MNEIIMMIIGLCTVHTTSNDISALDKQQLTCQKYYMTCIEDKTKGTLFNGDRIKQCVKDRKID